MKKTLSILLIVGGLVLVGLGVSKKADSSGGVSIGGLELSATDNNAAQNAYFMMGAGALAVAAGVFMSRK